MVGELRGRGRGLVLVLSAALHAVGLLFLALGPSPPVPLSRAGVRAPESGIASLEDLLADAPDSAPAAATASGPGVLASFAGLDRASIDSPGTRSFPPDPSLAVGPTHLLEGSNKGLRLSARDGAAAAAPLASLPLEDFFGAPADAGQVYDPKVVFDVDANGQRFWVAAAQTDHERRTSSLYLAFSKGPSPADLDRRHWCRYRFEGAYQGPDPQPGEPAPAWADYPSLGTGTDAVVLTSNHYRFGDNLFAHALVRAIDKGSVEAGCGPLRSWVFQPAAAFGDRGVITLQPVRQATRPASFPHAVRPIYLLNTLRPPAAAYRVWRLANVGTGAPILERIDVPAPGYDVPPPTPQLGSRLLIETGDARLIQAVGVGNTLWASHSTICDAGDGVPESCARVVRIQIGKGKAPGITYTARLTEVLNFGGGDGVSFWMPTVAANRDRRIAVAFLTSSADAHLGSAWTAKSPDAPAFPLRTLADGNCGRASSTRAGDFLGAQVDPVDLQTLWLIGERAWHQGRTCSWQSWIVRVDPAASR